MAVSLPPGPFARNSLGFESVFQNSLSEVMANGRWQELVAGLGADVAESVRQTMTSLAELVQTKRIGKHEARWLQAPLHRLYQAGLTAQRLSLLADHGALKNMEAVALDDMVAEAVVHHQQRSRTHRIAIELTSLEVMAQPEALASAIDSLLVWGMKLGRVLSVRLVKPKGQPRGELWLRVDQLDSTAHEERCLNSVDWYVLWQLARLKGVKVKRKVEDGRIRVIVRFNRVMNRHSGMAVLEREHHEDEHGFDPDTTVVWTVIPRSSLAAVAVNTLKPHIRRLEALPDVRALTADAGNPDCIVSVPEVLETEAFRTWRRRAQEQRGRNIAVIEITSKANVFDIGGFGPRAVARVSVDSVPAKLLSAVVFELSQLSGDGF